MSTRRHAFARPTSEILIRSAISDGGVILNARGSAGALATTLIEMNECEIESPMVRRWRDGWMSLGPSPASRTASGICLRRSST
jgi:hypothetical protein